MLLRALEEPIDMPIPKAPAPSEAAAESTLALIVPVLVAITKTAPLAIRVMVSMLAATPLRMLFSELAPAPLKAPPPKPTATASEAAEAVEWIVALSVAVTEIAPALALTTPATPLAALRLIWAKVVPAMLFFAIVAAIEIAPATWPKAALSATAPAFVSMAEALLAKTLIDAPSRLLKDPRIAARLSEAMVLTASTPEPESASPTTPPASAAVPAKTSELIAWFEAALTVITAPPPVAWVFSKMAEVRPRPVIRDPCRS